MRGVYPGGSAAGPGVRNDPGRLMAGALIFIAIGVTLGWLAGRHGQRNGDSDDVGPVVMAVQRIGELHTASYVMKDVLREQTQKEPSDGLSMIPGISAIVHWATSNQALVTAEGRVEAGVDLSELKPGDVTVTKNASGQHVLHIHLPPVHLYPADVHIRVVNEQNGAFWRDQNLIPAAEDKARLRFTNAAEQAGIRQTAQQNAVNMLTKMENTMGHTNVEFGF